MCVWVFFRPQVEVDLLEEQSGAQYTIKRLMDDIGNLSNIFKSNFYTYFTPAM